MYILALHQSVKKRYTFGFFVDIIEPFFHCNQPKENCSIYHDDKALHFSSVFHDVL